MTCKNKKGKRISCKLHPETEIAISSTVKTQSTEHVQERKSIILFIQNQDSESIGRNVCFCIT